MVCEQGKMPPFKKESQVFNLEKRSNELPIIGWGKFYEVRIKSKNPGASTEE